MTLQRHLDFRGFPKFRKIPRGVICKPLTGNIGVRNDFIFGDITKIRWAGVIAEPEHRSFAKIFFGEFSKWPKFSRFFRFFYFMIPPPDRLFLAYLQKKIIPFKILWTCRFFSYNNFSSVQLTYKHPVAVFQSDRNLCSLFAPSDYAVSKIFIFFLQCSGSQWRHNFCDFPVFLFYDFPT